ncbi:hypothetical protein ACPOL_1522 [Acidisarcina polymorpha]|uniref:DUF4252 domain-containing protein n=1 Tax=Acidisarcina polymorpha TaxID=2211140 RepID=A0A2Z5FVH4_9BACT|nr:hypothetical protein [Acidisarcina polymorpha]AXC10868.1 hypothetical protein ACPOL_1522 [Acidisarcina polymorpha]
MVALALWVSPFGFAASTPDQQPDWLPSGVEQLGRTAAFHTDFTFDRTMLQMASGLLDGGDADTRKAIAKLNGVTVHLYRYAQPGMYDPRQLDAIRQQYKDAGWKHLVSTQSHVPPPAGVPPGAVTPPPPPTAPAPYAIDAQGKTDLYIKFEGTDVTGMVVVQTSARNLNVVAINGDLSPLDLLHLRGHFGIPKFAGDGFAPADN